MGGMGGQNVRRRRNESGMKRRTGDASAFNSTGGLEGQGGGGGQVITAADG